MGITLEKRLSAWDDFLTRWPKQKVKELTLEEYVDVNNRDTFAYWLEHRTKILGSIRGGDSSKFGIYRRNKPPKGERSHIKHGEVYSWIARFGKTEEEAFDTIKKDILKVIACIESGDVNTIQEIGLADTLKWKLAFLYQDAENPTVINIFKRDMLRDACSDPTGDFSDLYRSLLKDRGDMHIVQYGYEIWNSLEETESADSEVDETETTLADNNMNTNKLNTILYGPPGTGKTYNTINKSLEIVDPEFYHENKENRDLLKKRFDELLNGNRIGFITFHQSFSYEDFVEGLKATTENNQVNYEIEDGIFKRLCESARAKPTIKAAQDHVDISGRKIWKMSLGDTSGDDAFIYQQCVDNGYVLLGYGYDIDFSKAINRKEVIKAYRNDGVTIEKESSDYKVTSVNNFKNEMSIGDLIVVSDGNRKFRAIAEITSDYYFDDSLVADVSYSQARKVTWHRVYEPSLPIDELFKKNLSQMTLYRLYGTTIDTDKLRSILQGSDDSDTVAPGSTVGKYQVESITSELITIRKSNGSELPISKVIVDELCDLVRTGRISIEDIKSKQVFDKVDTTIEKNFVNGYLNVLAPLVEAIINKGISLANQVSSDNRVLIIDEINRGNISNIFGELITLIETSKRAGGKEALSVKLPYSKEPFTVPDNLHIIGTMNTADKSLAQLDIALRRRFEFVEMMTNYELLEKTPDIDGINVSQLVRTINKRIELLYDREHTIGHSFFLPLKDNPSIDLLAEIFELQILPLLEEYFFEDWERVGMVLGDHLKQDESLRFVVEQFDAEEVALLMGEDWEQPGNQSYCRNTHALKSAEAYIGIYS
ncbi:AAA family ATPase [Photobacterium alginatilyticum]|uniref:ATPase n=1 Tax=Photobacterium alginatilyticum TaxID=1775171 RepID=A0ABW9YT19_9GAMM|nr:AAA family ATPase [Photobacterium alginatilyticum]NBI56016.1 ATPase [Photobacterium alginatilyticum]